uniref:Uncharacterized protein n=1 Tax=Parascaris univalens TaxID=6257 RepID=A0A915AD14_PARUN
SALRKPRLSFDNTLCRCGMDLTLKLAGMDGRLSRSHSQSSSSSSRSWSLIDNLEREVRDAHELSELVSSCSVTDCEYEGSEMEKRHGIELATDDCNSEPKSDVSALDESVEILSGSIKEKNVDLRKVCYQLDILSKCYEPPAERLLNSFLESDSRVKILTLLAVATLPLTVATFLKLAGGGWKYASHLDVHDSVCILNEDHLFNQHVSHLIRPSMETPLRPIFSWTIRPSMTPSDPSLISQPDHARTERENVEHGEGSANQCSEKQNERTFSAMRDAVRRYVAHTKSRRTNPSKTHHAKVVAAKASSNAVAPPLGVSRPQSDWCPRWSILSLNLTLKKSESVFEAIVTKDIWKNVTTSLLRIPNVAKKLFAGSAMVKIVAESKLAAKFHNAFSSVKKSINWSIAKVRMQRDRTIRGIVSSMAKIASLSPPKLASQCSSISSPPKENCIRNSTCHLLAALGHTLRSTHYFSSLVGRSNAKAYVESLRDGSACNAPRIACEKCWWTGVCSTEGCKFLPWQKSFDTLRFIASEPDMMLKSLATLGWPVRDTSGRRQKDILMQPMLQRTTIARQSETKDEMERGTSDWMFERTQRRTVHRMAGAR